MYERFISSSILTGILEAAISVMACWPGLQAGRAKRLDIQVLDVEGVVLDEFASRLDLVAHEGGEHQVRLGVILGPDLQQRALGGIHRGLPQRVGVHLAKTLV